jgi:anti-sigma regulatory factor (Ser/Thr protein kinase)
LAQKKECKLRSPKKTSTKKFLSTIGFNKFFKLDNGDQKIESRNVQLKRLKDIDYLLTDQILAVFGEYLRMSEGVSGSLKMALNELMTNAFDHSGSDRGCYVCAQSYPGAKTIRLCIADFGIGILTSLKKNNKYKGLANDNEAITLAVQEGVTSRKHRTGGYGLTHINRFIEVNGGKMHILSGRGKVLWNYSGVKKRKETKQTVIYPFEGTAINLLINADKEGFYFLKSEEGELFPGD